LVKENLITSLGKQLHDANLKPDSPPPPLDIRIGRRGLPSCCYCGACAAFVPDFVKYKKDEVMLRKGCGGASVGLCFSFCPMSFASVDDKTAVFGVNGTYALGYYRDIVTARSTDMEIQKHGQNGGAVTSLLDIALKNGVIDSAVIAGKSETWKPEPIVATTHEDVIAGGGSKYTACPSISGVWDAIRQGYKKIALVGTPCNIKAMRNLQALHDPYLHVENVKILIGLFCTEAFFYENLIKLLVERHVKVEDARKFDISNGKFAVYLREKKVKISLKEIESCVRDTCRICCDFAAEYADISAGAEGSKKGWTTLIIRTKVAEEVVKLAKDADAIEMRPLNSIEIEEIRKHSLNKKVRNYAEALEQMNYCSACLTNPASFPA
jgi:coenzyme F420 hydrogenase subunit beta